MIPKIIHQVWIGTHRIPNHINEWIKQIKESHPDYVHYLWTDDNLPDLTGRYKEIYDNMADPVRTSAKSDLLRIYLVHTYGGIYLDADFKMNNGFNAGNIDLHNIDGIISVNDGYGMSALGCSFMGFSQGHKFTELLLNDVISSDQWLGPNYWSLTLGKFFGYEDISKVSYDQFERDSEPYKVRLINIDELHANNFEHIALASWYPDSEWNLKLKSNDYE